MLVSKLMEWIVESWEQYQKQISAFFMVIGGWSFYERFLGCFKSLISKWPWMTREGHNQYIRTLHLRYGYDISCLLQKIEEQNVQKKIVVVQPEILSAESLGESATTSASAQDKVVVPLKSGEWFVSIWAEIKADGSFRDAKAGIKAQINKTDYETMIVDQQYSDEWVSWHFIGKVGVVDIVQELKIQFWKESQKGFGCVRNAYISMTRLSDATDCNFVKPIYSKV